MSKIALNSNASGSGVFTIESPNSDTDRTLNLPDKAGTVQVGEGIDDNATSTAITIDSSENVGINTGSPSALVHVSNNDITAYDGTATDGQLAAGATQLIQQVGGSNNALSQLVFQARSGFGYNRIASTGGSAPKMAFCVNNSERMRIDSAGVLMVGRTSAYNDGAIGKAIFQCGGLVGARAGMACIQDSTANVAAIGFVNPNGTVGSISTNGTATIYGTSSDYRLKENVVNLNNATDRLNQIPVHRFNFIADPDTTVDGFIAHEVADVVPEAIVGTKDAVDDEGSPVYQGIDQSKLVPLLTAALQEAVTRIETLETEVAALKAGD